MKGRGTITITMGCICFVLTAVMFMQFKTVKQTDITSIESMREAELRTEVSNWKNKYTEIEQKLEETKSKLDEYKGIYENSQESTEVLEKELREANILLGLTDVEGEGIVVTLSDNDEKNIEAYDILQLINELRLAGAEAISVNDVRIVNMSDVVDINVSEDSSFIVINGKRLSSPYTVKAIGNQSYLESGLTKKNSGYMDNIIKGNDKTATLKRENKIQISKYDGTMNLKYVEEGEQ